MTTTTKDTKQDESSSDDWMDVVVRKIRDLRYGSVQITVHDGRVTLVESVEKTRFNTDSSLPKKAR